MYKDYFTFIGDLPVRIEADSEDGGIDGIYCSPTPYISSQRMAREEIEILDVLKPEIVKQLEQDILNGEIE